MPRFSLQDKVRVKANPERLGIVDQVHLDGSEPQYDVFFSAVETRTYPEHALIPADEYGTTVGPVELVKQWRLGDADSFRGFLTLAKLRTPVTDNLYSFLASRTELLPYQFKPVLKLIESPYERILIADEVGLGKTIEAGIALMELNARSPRRRVLVVCPAALLAKWKGELGERFEWDFEILDGPRFRELLDEASANPEQPFRAIGSIELLRRSDNLELLTDRRPQLDAVIVDEAHHMRNHTTMANALGDTLSGLTDTMIFLTATPLNLGARDFFELMRLLVPDEFHDFETFESVIEPNQYLNGALRIMRTASPPDYAAALAELRRVERTSQARRYKQLAGYQEAIELLKAGVEGREGGRDFGVRIQRRLIELNTLSHVFTRTKKKEVSEYFPTRRATKVPITFTPEETEFYDAVTEWVIQTYKRVPIGFITVTFQRQAASCLPAMREKLRETILTSTLSFSAEEVLDVMDGDVESASDVSLDLAELDQARVSALQRLADAADRLEGIDSKFDTFLEALTETIRAGADKVLVFSFFIKTIRYLEERLRRVTIDGQSIEVLKLFGPTPVSERRAILNRFRTGSGVQVLLSSEVGSEGLDFQFCSTMFNYDLPWNPMKVEQRFGRLDRYGQAEEIINIFNMVVSDTIEDRIFFRLYDRIGIFQQAIGDLEAILGDELRQLQRAIFMRQLSPAEEEERSNAIADAIIRRQQEDEEFDEQSRRFLGLDEVFADQFNDIEQGRRYITSTELQNFVERVLQRKFPSVRLKSLEGSDGTFELTGGSDSQFTRFLTDAYYRDPTRSRTDFQLITRLQLGEPCHLTFEARRAAADRTLEFLSIHHPIVRAMVVAGDLEKDLVPTGALGVSGDTNGFRFFFVFEVGIKTTKEEIEFVATVVDPDGQLDKSMSVAFVSLVSEARPCTFDPTGLVTDSAVDVALGVARGWVGEHVSAKIEELERVQHEIVETRLESLRQSHERRLLRVQAQLDEAESRGQDQIARMRRGQKTNLIRQYEEKMRALESGRAVDVGYRPEPVAAGVLVLGE